MSVKNNCNKPDVKRFSSNIAPELLNQPIIQLGAAVYTNKIYCNCPGAVPGKIKIDSTAHKENCRFKKRAQSKEYVVETSVVVEDFKDGYGLGVAV